MQLDEIIEVLQKIRNKHGNIKAAIDVDGSYFSDLALDIEYPISESNLRGGEPLLVIR
jgi:hypothetical protein